MFNLGQRIAIIGVSGSGKSTLADCIGQKYNLPVIHLDQMAHIAGSAWIMRPKEEWGRDHDIAIQNEKWVMDGSYYFCMAQRFLRADTVIWIDLPVIICLWRFIARSIFQNKSKRIGALQNAQHEFSFKIIHYILCEYPKKRKKYQNLIDQNTHLKFFKIDTTRELNNFYQLLDIKWK